MLTEQQKGTVKLVARGLYDTQKLRIQLELRIARLVREGLMSKKKAETFFELPFKSMKKAEQQMERRLWSEIKDLPIVTEYLLHVKGIGPRISGILVANIYDISRFATVSKLWSYCGLDPRGGVARKRKKGEVANWSEELHKTIVFKLSASFLKCGSPYMVLYGLYRQRIIQREIDNHNIFYRQDIETKQWVPEHWNPDDDKPGSLPVKPGKVPTWTLGRLHKMGCRYIGKRFLSHLWHAWRELEGLPTQNSWVVEHVPGHSHQDSPWDFVERKPKLKVHREDVA